MKKTFQKILLISAMMITGALVACGEPTTTNSGAPTTSQQVDKYNCITIAQAIEYATDAGYKTSRSLYMVTNKITIDSSLITLSEFSESMYGDDVVKLNGKSVDKGFVAETIQSYSKDENMQIISLWRNVQSDYPYGTAYDINVINNLIDN